ncbi:MAG: flagellar filament capping protein FliD [Bacteriovoracaceae bacterium]|nr:flagellar filament capping protein FliD [Bacteriovoracaceae bacterium]
MGISFGSINSGLPKDIVQQLVNAEKIPIQQMEARKAKISNKQALVSQLTKLVENMKGEIIKNKGARSLREMKVNGGADNIAITADKNIAEPGKYQLEVLSLAQKSSAISNGVEDKDKTYIGVGYIRAVMPDGEEKEIYIDEEHASLTGVAKLINEQSDTLGMRANVINDGSGSDEPWKMVLSMSDTGDGAKAEFPYLYLVDGEVDIFLEGERPAQDAKIKLDGFEIEVPSNKVTDLIPGVTIDLKKAKPGEEISFEVTEDIQAIGGKMTSLVDNINAVLKFIKEQNTLSEKSDTSQTLGGDLTLQTIESRLRSTIFTPIMTDKGPMRIGDLGITYQREGFLKFDQAKFESVLAGDYKRVAQVLNGIYGPEGKTDGFIDKLEQTAQQLLQQPNGALVTRQRGLKSNIDQIDRQIATRQRMIDQKEEILKQRFARLEETISKIQGQGAGLAGLAQMGNPVTQLG